MRLWLKDTTNGLLKKPRGCAQHALRSDLISHAATQDAKSLPSSFWPSIRLA